MRMRILKGVLREGKMALGLSAVVMVGRPVVGYLARKVEQEAKREEKATGEMTPGTRKKLQAYRLVRSIMHVL